MLNLFGMFHALVIFREMYEKGKVTPPAAGNWLPMDTAPMDGSIILVPPRDEYNHAFYHDGYWFWFSHHNTETCVAGPIPKGWLPITIKE